MKGYIGESLKGIMYKRNLKAIDVIKASGLGQVQVSNLINNKAKPSVDVLITLADVLICSTDYLLGRK